MQEDNNAIETSIDSGICDDLTSPTTAEKADNKMKTFEQILLVLERDKLLRAEQRKRLSQLTERRQRKKRVEEPCNVCCIDLDGDNIKSSVKCVNCQKIACRGQSCSIWIPSQSGWECQLCNQSQESISKSSEWLHQQITGRYLSPFSARSEPSLLRNHHSPIPDVDRRSDVASSFYGEQKERVREMIEETLGEMLGGSLDNISVNQLYKSRQYLPTWENGEAPGMSHIKLKRFIEKIINDAIRLPNFTNEPSTPGPITDQDLPFFDPKKYQELLATAVLNKIVDSYNYEQKFENNNKDAATDCSDLDTNHNALISRKVQSGSISSSSIEPESDCSITDPPSHASRLEDLSRSSSAANQFTEAFGRYDRNSSSMLTDYLNKHSVPLPDFSIESDSSNEDNLSASKNVGPSWEGNWLFKKKRPGHESPAPIGMLVPSPKEDIKTQIGDKTADELSDLSEAGSECGDNNVDEIEDNAPNALIQNRNIIGGKSPIGLFDELLEQTSLISSSSIPEGDSAYTETKNDYVLGDDLNHDLIKSTKSFIAEEAINSLVDTQTLQNNLSKSKENDKQMPIKANLQELPKPRPRSAQKAAVYLSTKEIPESELTSSSTASSAIESKSARQTINNDPQSESTNTNTNNNLTQEDKPADYNITDTMLKKIQCTKASAIQFLVVVSLAPSLAVPTPDSETLGTITQAPGTESSQQNAGVKEMKQGEKSQIDKQGGLTNNDVTTQNKSESTVVEPQKDVIEKENYLRNDSCLDGMSQKSTVNDAVNKMESRESKHNHKGSVDFASTTLISTQDDRFDNVSLETILISTTAHMVESESVNEKSLRDEIEALEKCPESITQSASFCQNSMTYGNKSLNQQNTSLSSGHISENTKRKNDFEKEPKDLANVAIESIHKKDPLKATISFGQVEETDSYKEVPTSAHIGESKVVADGKPSNLEFPAKQTTSQLLPSPVVPDDKIKPSFETEPQVNDSRDEPEPTKKSDLPVEELFCRDCEISALKNCPQKKTTETFCESKDNQTKGEGLNLDETSSLVEIANAVKKVEAKIPYDSFDLTESYSKLILPSGTENIAENNVQCSRNVLPVSVTDINSKENEHFALGMFEAVKGDDLKKSHNPEKIELLFGNEMGESEFGTSSTDIQDVNHSKVSGVPMNEKKERGKEIFEPLCEASFSSEVASYFNGHQSDDRSGHTFKFDTEPEIKGESVSNEENYLSIDSIQPLHEDTSSDSSSKIGRNIYSSSEVETAIKDNENIPQETCRKVLIRNLDNVKQENSNYIRGSVIDSSKNISDVEATLEFVNNADVKVINTILSGTLDMLELDNEPKTDSQDMPQLSTKADVSDNFSQLTDSAITQPVDPVSFTQPECKLYDSSSDETLERKTSCNELKSTDNANPDNEHKFDSFSKTPANNSNEATQTGKQAMPKTNDESAVPSISSTHQHSNLKVPLSENEPTISLTLANNPLNTESSDPETTTFNDQPTLDEELPPECMTFSSLDLKEELSNSLESSPSISVIENSQENRNIAEITEDEIEALLEDEKPPETLDGIENLGTDLVDAASFCAQSSTLLDCSEVNFDIGLATTPGKSPPIMTNEPSKASSATLQGEDKIIEKYEEISCSLNTNPAQVETIKNFKNLHHNLDDTVDKQGSTVSTKNFIEVNKSDYESLKELTTIHVPANEIVEGCTDAIFDCKICPVLYEKQAIQSADLPPAKTPKQQSFEECTQIHTADQDEDNYGQFKSNDEKRLPAPNFIFESFDRTGRENTPNVISLQTSIPEEQVALQSKQLDYIDLKVAEKDSLQINSTTTEKKMEVSSTVPEEIVNQIVESTAIRSIDNEKSSFSTTFAEIGDKFTNLEENIPEPIISVSSLQNLVVLSNSVTCDELNSNDLPVSIPIETLLQLDERAYGTWQNEKENKGHNDDRNTVTLIDEDSYNVKKPVLVEISSRNPEPNDSYLDSTQLTKAECYLKPNAEAFHNKDIHFTEASYMIRISPTILEVESKMEDLSSTEESATVNLTGADTSQSTLPKQPQAHPMEPQQIKKVEEHPEPTLQPLNHFTEASYMIRLSSLSSQVDPNNRDFNHAKKLMNVDLTEINASQASLSVEPEKSFEEAQNAANKERLADPSCQLLNQKDIHFTEIAYAMRASSSLETGSRTESEKFSAQPNNVTAVEGLPETACVFNQGYVHFTEAPYATRLSSSLEVNLFKEPEKAPVVSQEATKVEVLTEPAASHESDIHFTEKPYTVRLSPSINTSSSVERLAEAEVEACQQDMHLSEKPYMIRLSPCLEDNSAYQHTPTEQNDDGSAPKSQSGDFKDEATSGVDSEVFLREIRNVERRRSSTGFLETIFERQDTMESLENPNDSEKVVENWVDTTFELYPNNDKILLLAEATNHPKMAEVKSNLDLELENFQESAMKDGESNTVEEKHSLNDYVKIEGMVNFENYQKNREAEDGITVSETIFCDRNNDLGSIVKQTFKKYEQENTTSGVVAASISPISEELIDTAMKPVQCNFSTDKDSKTQIQFPDCSKLRNDGFLAIFSQKADEISEEPVEVLSELESCSGLKVESNFTTNTESQGYKENAMIDSFEKEPASSSGNFDEKKCSSQVKIPNAQFKPHVLAKSDSEIATLESILHGDTQSVVESAESFVEHIIDPPADFATKSTVADRILTSTSSGLENVKDSNEGKVELVLSRDVTKRSDIPDNIENDEKVTGKSTKVACHCVDNNIAYEQKIELIDNKGVNNNQGTDVDGDVTLIPEKDVQKVHFIESSRSHFDNAILSIPEISHDLMKEEESLSKQEVIDEEFSHVKTEIASKNETTEAFSKPTKDLSESTRVFCFKSTSEEITSQSNSATTKNANSDSEINADESVLCLHPEENLNKIEEITDNYNLNYDTSAIKYGENERESAVVRTHETRNPERSILEIRKLIEEVLNDPVLQNSQFDLSNQETNSEVDFGIPPISESSTTAAASYSHLKNASQYIVAQMSSEISVASTEESPISIIDSTSSSEQVGDIYFAENAKSYSEEIETEKSTEKSDSASFSLETCTTEKDYSNTPQQCPISLVKSCIAALTLNTSQEDNCNLKVGELPNMLEKPHEKELSTSEITNQITSGCMHSQKANIRGCQTINDASIPPSQDTKLKRNPHVREEQLSTVEDTAVQAEVLVSETSPTPLPKGLIIIDEIKEPKNNLDKESLDDVTVKSTKDEICSDTGITSPKNDEALLKAIENPLNLIVNSILLESSSITKISSEVDAATAQSYTEAYIVPNTIFPRETEKISTEIESIDASTNIQGTFGEAAEEFERISHVEIIKHEIYIDSNMSSGNHKEISSNKETIVKVDSKERPGMIAIQMLKDSIQSDPRVENLDTSDVLDASVLQTDASKFMAANVESQEINISENPDESIVALAISDTSSKTCKNVENQVSTADSELEQTTPAQTLSNSLNNPALSETGVNDDLEMNTVFATKRVINEEINPDIDTVKELSTEEEKSYGRTLMNHDLISDTETSVQPILEAGFTNPKTTNIFPSPGSSLSSNTTDTNPKPTEIPASDQPSCTFDSAGANKTKESMAEGQNESSELDNSLKSKTESVDACSNRSTELDQCSNHIVSSFNSDTEVFAIVSYCCQSSNKMNSESPAIITSETISEIKKIGNPEPSMESITQDEVLEHNFAGKIFRTVSPPEEACNKILTNTDSSINMVLSCNANFEPEFLQTTSTQMVKLNKTTFNNEENKPELNFEPTSKSLNKNSSNFTSTFPTKMSNKFLDACKESSDTDLESWINHLEQVIIELSNSTSNASPDSTVIVEQLVDANSTELAMESTEIIADTISAGVSKTSSTLKEPMNEARENIDVDQENGSCPFDNEYDQLEIDQKDDVKELLKLTENTQETEVSECFANTENLEKTSEIQLTSLFATIAEVATLDDLPATSNHSTVIVKSQPAIADKAGSKPIIRREPTIVITQASSDSQSDNTESMSDNSGMLTNSETKKQFEDTKESNSLSDLLVSNFDIDSNDSSAEMLISHEAVNATARAGDTHPDDLRSTNNAMHYQECTDETSSSIVVNMKADQALYEGESIKAICDLEQQKEIIIGGEKNLEDWGNTNSQQTRNDSNILLKSAFSVDTNSPDQNNQLAVSVLDPEDFDEEINAYQRDYALEYESFTSMQFIRTPFSETESQSTSNVIFEPTDDSSEPLLSYNSFATHNSTAQTETPGINFEQSDMSVDIITKQTSHPVEMLTVERLECKATSSSSEDVSAYDTAPSSFTDILSHTPTGSIISLTKSSETDNIPTNSSTYSTYSGVSFKAETLETNHLSSRCCEESKQNEKEVNTVTCADGKHCIISDAIDSSSFIRPSEGMIYQQESSTAVTGTEQSHNYLGKELVELEHPIKIPIFEAKRSYERRGTLVSPSLEIAEDALEALNVDANYDTDPLPASDSSRISTDIEETTFMNPIYTSTDSLPWHAIKDDNEEVDGGLTSPESEPEFSITPPEISLCYMTPHVLDIIPEEFSESPPLDGISNTCLSSYQIREYFVRGPSSYLSQHQTEKSQESTKQSLYETISLNLEKTPESDATLDTTQQEDKLSSLTTAIKESSSAFTITNTELIQAKVEVSTLPTDKLTCNESSSTTTTTSNDTVCTAVESVSRRIESQPSTDDEVELHKDMETTLTKSPTTMKSYSVSMSMQLTNDPTNTPYTHQSTQNPSSTEVNVHSTSSKSAPTSSSTSPFHATRADSFGSASYATTKQQQIKFEILKHAAFSQPLPEEEDAAENGHISHFLPGSIAEREHKKWYNAVEMPNNPYSREALKRRLSTTSDKPMDIPNINSPLEKATSEDKLGRTATEDETIIEAPKVDYKRYGRDYYINDAKCASGSSKLKLSSSVSMHGLNVRDDKSLDKEPTLQSQQSLSSSLSSLHRSHSWGDKRSNLVPSGGGGSTCDIFTARPVRVEESDPILSRATKLEYLSTPERDFYLLPSEEISSLRSISASEHSLSQAGDSLTPSEDSDTIRVYDLKKQETRLIRDDDSVSAVTAVKGLIYTNSSSRAQPQQPGQTPPSPRAPLTTQRSFRTTVINRGSTPTAFKFLQPKRRLYDTRRIMSEDTSSIVRENPTGTNGTVEKSVIEEDVIPALPSVKALAKVFQGPTENSNAQLNRPKSYSWKSVDVKTKEESAPVDKIVPPEPVPRTILTIPPAVNGEEKLETEPAKESYSPPYEQKYIPAESPVIPPEENGTSAAEEDLKSLGPKESEVIVNLSTNSEPSSEPIQIEESSPQISTPAEEPVQTSQTESSIESSTVVETPKEEVHIPKVPCEDSYSPSYDQKYIPAEAPASHSAQEESETIQKPTEEKVDQSNSLEWKEDNIEIVSTPKDEQHATPPNTPETEEHKTPEEADKPIIESISLPTETLEVSSMNPSHKPTIVEQFLENEKRSAMRPVVAVPLTNASVSEAAKNDSAAELVSEPNAVQISSSISSSAVETTAPDTTSTLEPTDVLTPAELVPSEGPTPALEPTSEPILTAQPTTTEEPTEPSAPTSTAAEIATVEPVPAAELTPESSLVREPSPSPTENSIAEKEAPTLNNDHPTIDTKPAQNGFSEPSLASPTQNASTEQSKQNNAENRRSEIRFTQESHTRDRPISPVLVPGKLKSSIAFFENLKNKK